MRLFVALDIPEDRRRALEELLRKCSAICRSARWVRPEGLHLTLKFIGNVEDKLANEIKAALASVHFDAPIELAFSGFGFFPNERRPRVFWIGIQSGPNLARLATEIETALEPLGIARESRDFTPHLTLARFKTAEGLPALQKMLAALPSVDSTPIHFREFWLYQSMLKSGGAEYTKLARYEAANAM